jgi:hypothetical protein
MRSAPVVLDPRYVYAFTVYYSLAALWGLLATRNGIAAIYDTGGAGYEAGFAFGLAIVSAVLAFLTTTDHGRVEAWVTLLWVMLVVAFPAAAAYQWAVEGDINRAAPSAAAFMYLVFPAFRWFYLVRKRARENTHG